MGTKTKHARRRLGGAYWTERVAEQSGSGLSQRAYCEEKGLCLGTFARWKKRFDEGAAGAAETGPWLEVPLSPVPQAEGWDIELDLGGGVCLRLRQR